MSGSAQRQKIAEAARQGIYLSTVLALCTFIAGCFCLYFLLSQMKLTPEARYIAKYYVVALEMGLLPVSLFNLLRCFPDALGQTKVSMFILAFLPLDTGKSSPRIGIPAGFAIFFETNSFAAGTLFMSAYNTETIATLQTTVNFASFLYLVSLSIAMTLTIIVGFEIVEGRFTDARIYAYIGIGSGITVTFFAGVILFSFDESISPTL